MTFQVIAILAPVFLIVLVGYLYARFDQPDMQVINRIIMQLLVPALILSVMSSKDFEILRYSRLSLSAVGVILTSGLAAFFVAQVLGYRWRTIVPPMMFGNWGNLGLPLIVLAFGDASLNAAVILFITGNIMHFTVGTAILSGRFSLMVFFKTPVILAVMLGLLINVSNLVIADFLLKPLDMLGQVAIPLMLLSLGVRLNHVHWNDLSISLIIAVLCPTVGLLAAYGFGSLLQLESMQLKQLLIFGALPPAVMNFMFAEQYKLEPEKVASIVMVSNLFAIGTYFVLLYLII